MLAARTNVASTSALNASVARATTTSSRRGALVVTAASKKKDVRLQVTLECTEQKESGVQGMSRYITMKVRARASMSSCAFVARRVRTARRARRRREGWMPVSPSGFPRARRLTQASRDVRAQNRRNTSQRLELMKYNPFMKKHTLHRELKK